MAPNPSSILALDVGTVRIGVAIASLVVRLPRPLTTLLNDEKFIDQLIAIIEKEAVATVVVGLPRGLDGQETAQTSYVRNFVADLSRLLGVSMPFQDEALSSARAKSELEDRGKSYQKADVDALAATFILDDYLQANTSVSGV